MEGLTFRFFKYKNKREKIVNNKELIDFLSENPDAGVQIVGSGGCRKLRFAGKGKGKSGGYRVITYFYDDIHPVYLLLAFAKNQKANISKAQVNELAKITRILKDG